MPKTNEKLADILAEMRAAAKSTDLFDGEEVGEPLIRGTKVEEWADRIEAAAERERDEDRQLAAIAESDEAFARCARCDRPERATGNAAALRGALENVERVARFCAEAPRHTPAYPTDAARADVLYSRIAELGRVARAAIAAPARNCDRFATFDEARKAFQEARGHKVLADVELWDSMDEAGALVRWLFDTAKGGAKCIDGLRGHPDCRGCNEHCLDVRKRNCFYWNPDIEGGVCALTGKKSCPISCDNFHIPENVSPPPAEGEKE